MPRHEDDYEGYAPAEEEEDLDLGEDDDDEELDTRLPSERSTFVDPGIEDEEVDEDEADEAERLAAELARGEQDEALGRAGPDE